MPAEAWPGAALGSCSRPIAVSPSAAAVAPLSPGAVLGVLSSSGDPTLPDAARTIVRERRVRAVALAYGGAAEDATVAIAATCAGAALAAGSRAQRTPLDPIVVARVVAEHLATRGVTDPGRLPNVRGARSRAHSRCSCRRNETAVRAPTIDRDPLPVA